MDSIEQRLRALEHAADLAGVEHDERVSALQVHESTYDPTQKRGFGLGKAWVKKQKRLTAEVQTAWGAYVKAKAAYQAALDNHYKNFYL